MDRCICSWVGRLIIVNMSILPKLTYRFNAIPVQIPLGFVWFLVEIAKLVLKFRCKFKGPRRVKTSSKRTKSYS